MKTNSLDFDAQALREKILDLAMRGKLVPQDPNDEPASVLLEKIKAEKAELIKEKKIKKTKPLPPITDDEKLFDIPDSWEWVRLGDVAEIIMGQAPKGNTVNSECDGIEFHQGKTEFTEDIIGKSDKFTTSLNKVIDSNYIVMAVRAPVGDVNLVNRKIAIGRGLSGIKGYVSDKNYIFYYLGSMKEYYNQRSTGSTFKAINGNVIKNTPIALPPLSEQSRIAAKIAQLFALLRKVETSTQQYAKLQTLLKSKVLDLAMRGKLVKQDPNDEPASVLLEKIKAEKAELIKEKKIKKTKPLPPIKDDEKPFAIPDSWEWVRLGDIFSINDRNKANIETEVGFLPMKDILDGYDGTYTFETRRWGDIKSGYTHIKNGDIALAKITPCFQNLKSCVVNNLPNKIGAATTEIYALNPILKSFSYLYVYFLKSPFFINSGMKNFTGNVGQQRVPKKFVETFVIPLPPLNEQFRIKNCLVKLLELLA